MTRYARICTVAALAVILLSASTQAFAQQPAAGQIDVLGFGGGVSDGGGATFGGGVQFAVTPRMLIAGEAGYLTGGNDFQGFGVDVDFHALSIDANAHYLFPLSDAGRFTPYVLGGLGALRSSASVSAAGVSAGASDSTIGINLGGGARWLTGTKWGVQPELKVFVADGSNIRFSAAVFYQFGS